MADWETPEPPEASGADEQGEEAAQGVATPAPSQGRRRLLQGLVSASPGILTIAGRPAWANNCSNSGNHSGNASTHDDEVCAGEGCSPGFWLTHTQLWNHDFRPESYFYHAFGADIFPQATLYEVICKQARCRTEGFGAFAGFGEGQDNKVENLLQALGFQSVAALQNAANGVRYELTVADVQRTCQMAFESGSLQQVEMTKDSLDQLNNRYCPLPNWG